MALKTALAIRTKVTTQVVLATRLLRLSGPDVDEAVMRELAENPALERKEPPPGPNGLPGASRTALNSLGPLEPQDRSGGNRTQDWGGEDPMANLPSLESSTDRLLSQARLVVPAKHLGVVSYLVYSLDEHGFLRVSAAEIASELGVSRERVLDGIKWLQQLDPPGIGARDLRECFLLQCADLGAQGVGCESLVCMLEKAWDHLMRTRWDMVARSTGLSRQEIDAALRFMRHNLYPYPLSLAADGPAEDMILSRPDVVIRRAAQGDGGRFLVQVPAAETCRLVVSPAFRLALRAQAEDNLEPDDREWIRQAIERARVFMAALEQRWSTLRRVGEFLARYQADFLARGARFLRPLTRAEVARQLGVHESTISRAVRDKVLQLPDGRLIQMSDLFDRSLAAKDALSEIITRADRPLSDRELAAKLQNESIFLARRTVAKYRRALGFSAMGHRGWGVPG